MRTFRSWPALLILPLSLSLVAQQPSLSVDAVLTRVRTNLSDYVATLPNLSADESVDSQRLGDGNIKDEMTVQSSFRITRAATPGIFNETRLKNLVNGKPPKSQKVVPPYTFNGGFANVLGTVRSECNHYRLADADPSEPGKLVLIFTPLAASPDHPACNGKNDPGRAVLDPATFQIVHFERQRDDMSMGWTAHLPFVPVPSDHNTFTLSADYAPVLLGDKSFWLPTLITSTITDKAKPIVIHHEARYSNYHRFASTVTISDPVTPQ